MIGSGMWFELEYERRVFSNCTLCLPGKFKDVTRSAECTDCSTISNWLVGSTTCTCNPGATGPNGGECILCQENTFKSQPGIAVCSVCPSNTVSGPGAPNCGCIVGLIGPLGGPCNQCVKGTFKSTTGSVACTTCTNNSYSAFACKSVDNCTCNAGYFGLDSSVSCLECAAGTYKTSPGEAACEQCTINSDSSPTSLQCACNAGSASTNWHCAVHCGQVYIRKWKYTVHRLFAKHIFHCHWLHHCKCMSSLST